MPRIVETDHDARQRAVFAPAVDRDTEASTVYLLEHGSGPGAVRVSLETLRPGVDRRLREFGSSSQTVAVVIGGRLEVEDDRTVLSPGQALIQPGSDCSVRSADDQPCHLLLACFVAEAPAGTAAEIGPTDGVNGDRVRRVVVAGNTDRGIHVVEDREPPISRRPASDDRVVMTRHWETGGVLSAADAGGDVLTEWQLGPAGGGACVDLIEMDPQRYVLQEEHWHATDTIDVDVIIAGSLELRLPEQDPVVLQPGDVVIQRGTNHQWIPLGTEVMRMATVMIAVDPSPGNDA